MCGVVAVELVREEAQIEIGGESNSSEMLTLGDELKGRETEKYIHIFNPHKATVGNSVATVQAREGGGTKNVTYFIQL